jgi:hypothetical protein
MLRVRSLQCLSVILFACSPGAIAQTIATVRVPLKSGDFVAVVTFDESRLSAKDITQWMELSPEGFYSEPQIAVHTCKAEITSEYVPKFRAAMDETAKLIRQLDPSDYPDQLSEVVTYLRRQQSFWLWNNQQELQFLSVGSSPATQWDDIDTGRRCEWTVAKMRRAKGALRKCKAVLLDWNNCVNKAVQDHLGPYPKNSWDSFLRSNGIQVRMLSTVGD